MADFNLQGKLEPPTLTKLSVNSIILTQDFYPSIQINKPSFMIMVSVSLFRIVKIIVDASLSFELTFDLQKKRSL